MAERGTNVLKRVINTPLKEIWEDPYFIKIRKSFDNGEKDPACKKCWEEEDAGRDSKRIRDNKKFEEYFKNNNIEPWNTNAGIKIVELNAGNTCNIQCRTCHPYSSSKWVKEFYDVNIDKNQKTWKVHLQESKVYNDSWEEESLVWEELDKIGQDVVQIDVYGGEPWLLKKQWEFMRKSVDKGWSKNQTIHYNTNGTQWDPELISLFDHFKNVNVGFSIDGIGEQFEFMRYLAKWETVLNNLSKAKEYSKDKPHLHFDICHTISSLNVFYIPEFIEYFERDWSIYLNLVHWPHYYAITIFPDKIKEIIVDKLERINQNDWNQVPGIINLIKSGKFNQSLWDEFKRRIDVHDQYRNQDYYKTFPEFGEIIRRYG
jgi:MoaA/NifB/PqqE/SkfB family radical SAM enzyme